MLGLLVSRGYDASGVTPLKTRVSACSLWVAGLLKAAHRSKAKVTGTGAHASHVAEQVLTQACRRSFAAERTAGTRLTDGARRHGWGQRSRRGEGRPPPGERGAWRSWATCLTWEFLRSQKKGLGLWDSGDALAGSLLP